MEKTIIDIIDEKAEKQYAKLSSSKLRSYRAMLYAGVQTTINGRSVRNTAAELGYSEGATSKLIQKWIGLMQEGDITVNRIISAIHKLPNSIRFRPKEFESKCTDDGNSEEMNRLANSKKLNDSPSVLPVLSKPKVKKVLGFIITPEEERRARAAIRSSILFFQDYGKGRQPRMNGEYYAPGTYLTTRPDSRKWLPLDTAAIYCGCKPEIINTAGQNGTIERRVYKHSANRNYYEYNIADLDKFIKDNHLL